jgi:hypothetical protein
VGFISTIYTRAPVTLNRAAHHRGEFYYSLFINILVLHLPPWIEVVRLLTLTLAVAPALRLLSPCPHLLLLISWLQRRYGTEKAGTRKMNIESAVTILVLHNAGNLWQEASAC